jgi:hypothetical protein
MTLAVRLLAVSVFTILLACGPGLRPLELPPQRSNHSGFSFLPPNEEGWTVISRDGNALNLPRKGSNPNETYAISTDLWALPPLQSKADFINSVIAKEGQSEASGRPPRFKLLKHDVAPYPKKGDYCALSHVICEDRGAKLKHSGGLHLLVLEIVSLTCRHPSNGNVAIKVSYSHRHYPYHGDPSLSEKAQNLFQSVEFTELR